MGKADSAGWPTRRVRGSHTHRESRDPSPLGLAGTPLVPALTHSTSGAVTGSNARLGTLKDLSSGHETPYRHFRADDIRTTLPSPAAQITVALRVSASITSSQMDRSRISEDWPCGHAWELGRVA